MSFETIVRPAASVPVLKAQGVAPETPSADAEAVIEWGSGPLGVLSRSAVTYNTSISYGGGSGGGIGPQEPPPDENVPTFYLDEVSRATHTVRITQQDNPDNWVDVEVIDQLTLSGPAGYYVFRFSNPQ